MEGFHACPGVGVPQSTGLGSPGHSRWPSVPFSKSGSPSTLAPSYPWGPWAAAAWHGRLAPAEKSWLMGSGCQARILDLETDCEQPLAEAVGTASWQRLRVSTPWWPVSQQSPGVDVAPCVVCGRALLGIWGAGRGQETWGAFIPRGGFLLLRGSSPEGVWDGRGAQHLQLARISASVGRRLVSSVS